MNPRLFVGVLTCLIAIGQGFVSLQGQAVVPSSKAFAFVNASVILTAERGDKSELIINLINLAESLQVFEAKNLIVKTHSGKASLGQVIGLPESDNKGNTWKYRASLLIQPRTAQGFSVYGPFGDLDRIESITIKIGGKAYYLDAFSITDFNVLASKISDVDLKQPDIKRALDAANLQNVGRLGILTGTDEIGKLLSELITPDGVNPPKITERKSVFYNPSLQKTVSPGTVKISGTITKDGDLIGPKIVRGGADGLAEKVLEVVRNSWRFLPATKNGEVVESSVAFEVEVKPEKE